MSVSGLLLQLLNGLADASALFLVAAGLSLVFGVTRIVNFAHGSFYMLGMYLAVSLTGWASAWAAGSIWAGPAYWLALPVAALIVGVLGGVLEVSVLRRIYRAPELYQLLATFAFVLLLGDLALAWWGPADRFAARAPGLSHAVELLGRRFPAYDLFLILAGPLVLALLWLLQQRTRWGMLLRAAAENRDMLAALGVNQALLFTSAFVLGAFLAGLGGALAAPRVPATLSLDIEIIASAFVVVVVGGLGSIPGAFLAALLICEIKALCIFIGDITLFGQVFSLSRLTLAAEFIVMAVVLIWRPWGLLGKPVAAAAQTRAADVLRPAGRGLRLVYGLVLLALALLPVLSDTWPYLTVLGTDMLIAALFAASLHFLIGPAGLHSFGHAAWFGLGAYGAAFAALHAGLPMEAALLLGPLLALAAALLFGWFCVRLSGVYMAMLTLAVAQIIWALAYQFDRLTGGSNGLIGLWPSPWLDHPDAYYYLSLGACALGVWVLRRVIFSPLGLGLRAARDHAARAQALGIHSQTLQWAAFMVAALFAGLAGSLYAFSKGSIAPDVLAVSRSVDGLVMVMLGGLNTLAGPLAGATAYTWLHDSVARITEYWHAVLGLIILVLVVLLPGGLLGTPILRGARHDALR